LLRRRGSAVPGLAQLILDTAPLEQRQHLAGRETLARCVEADFPWRVRVGDTVTRCKLSQVLSLLFRKASSKGIGARPSWDRSAAACVSACSSLIGWSPPHRARYGPAGSALWIGRTSSVFRSDRGKATPIMQSRVTISASCPSVQFSVPTGRGP
jgi:hypothetical protein